MARCLNLTKAGEYAIAAMSRLARETRGDDDKTVSVAALAEIQRIPPSFLSKILSLCAKAGLVRARKGVNGGVTLSRPAHKISLLSVVEACEGAYSREDCVFFANKPCTGPACEVYCPLREKEDGLRESLSRVTLADMAASLDHHPFLKQPA